MIRKILLFINILLFFVVLGLIGRMLYFEFGYAYFLDEKVTKQSYETQKIEQSQGNYQELVQKGQNLLDKEVISLALGYFQKAKNLEPQNPKAYIGMARGYLLSKSYPKAMEYTMQALQKDPQNNEALGIKALLELRQGYIRKAENTLQSIQNPGITGMYAEALLLAYNGDKDALKSHFETKYAYKLEPLQTAVQTFENYRGSQDLHLKALLAKGVYQMEEYELARLMAKEVVMQKGDYRDGWLVLGLARMALNEYVKSKEAFIEARQNTIYAPEIDFYLGYISMLQEKYGEAKDYYTKAKENGFEDTAYLYKEWANLKKREGDYKAAYSMLQKHIDKKERVQANDYIALIALLLNQIGDTKEAIALGRELVQKFPESSVSHNLLGWSLLRAEKYEPAKKELDIAFEYEQNSAAVHLNLGDYYKYKENYYKAQKHYKKAFELDPYGDIGTLGKRGYNAVVDIINAK